MRRPPGRKSDAYDHPTNPFEDPGTEDSDPKGGGGFPKKSH